MQRLRSNASLLFEDQLGKLEKPNVSKDVWHLMQAAAKGYAALIILPDLMQRVQTFIRPFPPDGSLTRID